MRCKNNDSKNKKNLHLTKTILLQSPDKPIR